MIQFQDTAKAQPALDPQSVVYRMADKMRTVAMNGRSVDADVLGEEFTQAEIDANWRDARDLARTLAVRKVA